MSRSYRIRVSESVDRTLRAEDRVSTQLEILEVLPPEQMAGLLADELKGRGFGQEGGLLVRKEDGVRIAVDPATGTVTVIAEASEDVRVGGEKEGRAWDDTRPNSKQVREQIRTDLRKELEQKADERQAELQGKVTDRLEAKLCDLQQELDQAVNSATAEALKVKAAQLGQIKELTEDKQTGSLTIVVEV